MAQSLVGIKLCLYNIKFDISTIEGKPIICCMELTHSINAFLPSTALGLTIEQLLKF